MTVGSLIVRGLLGLPLLLQACQSPAQLDIIDPPSQDPAADGRWVRIHSRDPGIVPYLFSSQILVQGEGFDGIRSVVLLYQDGVRFGVIEGLTSTSIVFRTPEPSPRWSTASLILSETPDAARRAHGRQTPRQDPAPPENYFTSAVHEMGHGLGLWAHSPYLGDVMSTFGDESLPSERDIATLKHLYSQPPDLTD